MFDVRKPGCVSRDGRSGQRGD